MIARRALLRGLFAAPAVVAVGNIMPVKVWEPDRVTRDWIDAECERVLREQVGQLAEVFKTAPASFESTPLSRWGPIDASRPYTMTKTILLFDQGGRCEATKFVQWDSDRENTLTRRQYREAFIAPAMICLAHAVRRPLPT